MTTTQIEKPLAQPRQHAPRTCNALDQQIGDNIRAQRKQNKMSQQALGDALGITFQQVQKYERGANRVPASRMIAIADALHCGLLDLYDGIANSGLDQNAERTLRSSSVNRLIQSHDGMDFIIALDKINSPALRRSLLVQARTLAEIGDAS